MKNYSGFFIILFLLCLVLVLSTYFFDVFEHRLLQRAYEMQGASEEGVFEIFEEFCSDLKKYSPVLQMLTNHTTYKDINKYAIQIKYDIENGDRSAFYTDIDHLVFLIEEMINGEKCKINNRRHICTAFYTLKRR